MQAKLTLRIDKGLIEKAKTYARQSGKSVSRLVSDYLEVLSEPGQRPSHPLTPIVESLLGSLAGSGLDENNYRQDLEKKHLRGS
jgi:Family of unknown function (DUF6364)